MEILDVYCSRALRSLCSLCSRRLPNMNEKGFRTACSRLGVNALGHYRLGPRRGVSAVAVGLVLGGEGGRRRNVAPSPAAQDVRDERLGDAVAPRDLGLGETAARVLG